MDRDDDVDAAPSSTTPPAAAASRLLQRCSRLSRQFLEATRGCGAACRRHDVSQLRESHGLLRRLAGHLYSLAELAASLEEESADEDEEADDCDRHHGDDDGVDDEDDDEASPTPRTDDECGEAAAMPCSAPSRRAVHATFDRSTLVLCSKVLGDFERLLPPENPGHSTDQAAKSSRHWSWTESEKPHFEACTALKELLPVLQFALSASSTVALLRSLSSTRPALGGSSVDPTIHNVSTRSGSLEDAVVFGGLSLEELSPEQERALAISMIKTLAAEEHNRRPGEVKEDWDIVERRDKENPFYGFAALHWMKLADRYWDDVKDDVLRLVDVDTGGFLALHWLLEYLRQWWPPKYGRQALTPASRFRLLTTWPRVTSLHLAVALGLPKLTAHFVKLGHPFEDVEPAVRLSSVIWCAFVGPLIFTLDDSDRDPTWTELVSKGPLPVDWEATLRILIDRGVHRHGISAMLGADGKMKSNLGWVAFMVCLHLGASDLFLEIDKISRVDADFVRQLDKEGAFGNIPESAKRSSHGTAFLDTVFQLWMDRALPKVPTSDIADDFFNEIWCIVTELKLDCGDPSNKRRVDTIPDDEFRHYALRAAKDNRPHLVNRLVRDPRWDPNRHYEDEQPPIHSVSVRLHDGGTVLHAAVEAGCVDSVRLIVESGANIEALDNKGRTPVLLADSWNMLRALVVEHGANTEARDSDGYSIWHYHASENNDAILTWLGAHDSHKMSSLRALSQRGRTPLAEALSYIEELAAMPRSAANNPERPRAALAILRACTDFGSPDSNCGSVCAGDRHVLCLAAEWGNMEIMKWLSDVKSSLPPIGEGENPLHSLNFSATEEFVGLLTPLCEDLPVQRSDGKTPAETVFLNFKVMRPLIRNKPGSSGRGALTALTAHPSCAHELHKDTYMMLLTPKALEARDEKGRGLWERFCVDIVAEWAAKMAELSLVEKTTLTAVHCLIEKGVLQSYEQETDNCGLLLLLETFMKGSRQVEIPNWMASVFSCMLENTAKIDKFKESVHALLSLRWAIRGGHLHLMNRLLAKGLSVHDRLEGHSTLEECCSPNHPCDPATFSQLLKHADPKRLDELDESLEGLIHLLIDPRVKYRDEKLRLLLDKGANPNLRRVGNAPALVSYILDRQVDAAMILLDRGADFTLSTKDGLDAALAAASRGSVRLLTKIKSLANDDFDWKRTCTSRFTIYHHGGQSTTFFASQCTALHMAAFNGHDNVLQFYLGNFDLDPNAPVLDDLRRAAHFAALGGWNACIRALHAKGADLGLQSKDGSTALHVATKSCQPAAVRTLLELGPKNVADRDGLTPYLYSLRFGIKEIVDLFHEHAPGIFSDRGPEHASRRRARIIGGAFETAVNASELSWCKNILAATSIADIDSATLKCGGCTPLMLAVRKGRLGIIDWLVKSGSRGFAGSCKTHFGPLGGFDALTEVCERQFATLAAAGPPPPPSPPSSPPPPPGWTRPPVTLAQMRDAWFRRATLEFPLMEAYLKSGLCWITSPLTPIHAVAHQNNLLSFMAIMAHLKYRATEYRELIFKMGNREKQTLSDAPAEQEWVEELQYLAVNMRIYHDDLHDPYELGWTPLHVAMDSSAADVAAALAERGADIEAQDAENQTPLYVAVRKDFAAGVRLLLERGANPNVRNYQSYSPLMRAAERGHVEIARLLVEHGADVHVFEPDGMSLLNICGEQSKSPALFAYLLSLGLDPYRQDKAGYMPLHDMILNGEFASYVMNADFDFWQVRDINKGLLSMVIELNRRGSHSVLHALLRRLPAETRRQLIDRHPPRFVGALCNAVHRDEPRAIDVLVAFGADVDAEGSGEGSALMVACMKGRLEAVRALVGHGASIAYTVVEVDEENGGVEKVTVRNALEAAKRFPEIVAWLLVGRFAEKLAITAEEELDDIDENSEANTGGNAIKSQDETTGEVDAAEKLDETGDDNGKSGTATSEDLNRKNADTSKRKPQDIRPWSGVVVVEVDLLGVGDQHGRAKDESRLAYLKRMSSVRASYRGMMVLARNWHEELSGPSRWDVD